MEAPDDFTRSVPFTLERAADGGDGLTLSGHAAVFNQTTRIDSWEGKFDERIAPGAFKKSLSERKPVLMFEHGQHPLIGSMPLGRVTKAREDNVGLLIESRLHDNWLIEPVRDAVRSGAVDGMSFRFQVIKDTWDDSGDIPLRTLNEVRVAEVGPVVFPAYDGTDVAVRFLFNKLPDPVLEELRQQILSTQSEAGSTTSLPEPQVPEPASDHSDSPTRSGLLLASALTQLEKFR